MPVLEKRVSRLEEVFERFIYEMQDFKDEMREFKDEMKEFKNEMQEFKDEMREFKDEMKEWRDKTDKTILRLEENVKELKENVKELKENTRELKENIKEIQLDRKKAEERWEKESKERDERWEREKKERDEKWEKEKKERDEKWEKEKKERDEKWEKEKREMNKRWGELANKMGTIVEDIVAPNIPTVAEKYFGIKYILYSGIRIKKANEKKEGDIREFDFLLVSKDSVILNETKTTIRQNDLNLFVEFIKKGLFFDYFPEYQNKKLIPILSSLSIDKNAVAFLSENGIYAMAMKGDSMDILNPDLKI